MSTSGLYETLKSTALAHAKAYETPVPFSNASIQAFRTPDCVHNLHPAESIPAPFDSPIEPAGFAQAMTLYGGPVSRLEFEVRDLVVDVERRTVVVRMDATFDFKANPAAGDAAVTGWRTQYMWLTEMNEEGTKVKRVEEFMDPGRLMGELLPRAQRWAAREGGSES